MRLAHQKRGITLERTVLGKITFEVSVSVDCMKNELEHENCERISELFYGMDSEILLRKLLNDSSVTTVVEDVEFNEVD